MKTASDLQNLLRSIDRKSYPAYKDTRGVYRFPGFVLSIDHVQGDPFAAPSKISVQLEAGTAGFPRECYESPHRRIAMQDYLLRLFSGAVEKFNYKAHGSGKSGLLSVSRCAQEVLERTAVSFDQASGALTLRLEAGFPAHGRTICSGELEKILFDFLPRCVQSTLYYKSLNAGEVQKLLFLADDRAFIRAQLPQLGLIAFVANGAVLPRRSGVSSLPMQAAVPFCSPKSMEVTLLLPHHGPLTGMGIHRGVTLIVGGGYHGKSTLLNALELGVYDHIAGDGREFVITDADAVKIRAEDGRSVKNVDISMFINHLPNGKDTVHFSTEDASGSTSQAANVVEALESGASALLIDEDTSATNFMVRDALMQQIVLKDKEPITPFIERIRPLYDTCGISTVLVAGSSGAFFFTADTILQMDNYVPKDITAAAKAEAAKHAGFYRTDAAADGAGAQAGAAPQDCAAFQAGAAPQDCAAFQAGLASGEHLPLHLPDFSLRKPLAARSGAADNSRGGTGGGAADGWRGRCEGGAADARGGGRYDGRGRGRGGREHEERTKVKSMGREAVSLNKETIRLHYVEQLVDTEQTAALGYLLAFAQKELFHGSLSMTQAIDKLLALTESKGLSAVVEGDYLPAGLAMPRRQEVFACFNRYRNLTVK